MSDPSGRLSWDLAEIARALKISPESVRAYFTDGRRVSFILERRLAAEVLNATLAPSEGSDHDLVESGGAKWEVRSLSAGGVYFCPSYMVGSGRTFNEAGFLAKLDQITGYILADIISFPDVPFWMVPTANVRAWWQEGRLGTTSKISRPTALRLLALQS